MSREVDNPLIDQLHDAIRKVKSARNRVDRTLVHKIADSRLDGPLIELRHALRHLEQVAMQMR